ncbi:MAG: FtsW/RodA/SpoVE family cell cycle protein, partial [bacterium]|nr:FtsW/RodA/SpoVE family cell cycle protein [Candidatus Colisoma equi]
VLYLVLAAFDYRKWIGLVSVPVYGLALLFLVVVLLVGSEQFGGRRWLWFFQPSEVAKLAVILLLAALFGTGRRSGFVGFLLAGVLVGVPILLILAEPDLGTALTLVPAVLVMLLAAGVWRRGLFSIVAVGGLLAMTVLGAVYEAERPGVSPEHHARIMRYVPLKDHQVRRIRTFLFPESDSRGAGYNLRQAKISIGSGGFTGRGIGRGETNHLKYLPPAVSMNDFIFCVYAEETGFVGSMVLLALFGVLFLSCCRIASVAADGTGRILSLGVATLVFAHVYINIAMSIGLLPITGLPLPFISSGRTFLIVVMCALGLVQNVAIHGKEKSC